MAKEQRFIFKGEDINGIYHELRGITKYIFEKKHLFIYKGTDSKTALPYRNFIWLGIDVE